MRCVVLAVERGENMIKRISWEQFRQSGMLWWVNRILHTFGLVIVVEVNEDGKVLEAYPAECDYQGFGMEDEIEGFAKVSQYMKKR